MNFVAPVLLSVVQLVFSGPRQITLAECDRVAPRYGYERAVMTVSTREVGGTIWTNWCVYG